MTINQEVLGAAVALAAATVPLVRAWVQAKLTALKLQHASGLATVAVKAAAQLALDGNAVTGATKLNYASDLLVSLTKRIGLKLTTDEVLGFIHAALREMQQVEAKVGS